MRFRFLFGNPVWIAALTAMLRYPDKVPPEPPPQIMLFDRRGTVASSYGGNPLSRSRLEGGIALLDTFPQGLDAPTACADSPHTP